MKTWDYLPEFTEALKAQLKVAGEALIAWIRENHPEMWKR